MLLINEKFKVSGAGRVPGTGFMYSWELGQDMHIRSESGNEEGIGLITPFDTHKKYREFTMMFAEDSSLTPEEKKVCRGLCKVFAGLDNAIMNAVISGLYDIADNLVLTGLMPFTGYARLNPDAGGVLADYLTDYALKSVVTAILEGTPEELEKLMRKDSVLWPLAESIIHNTLFTEWESQAVSTDRNLRITGYGTPVK